jgi:hypothetical protein
MTKFELGTITPEGEVQKETLAITRGTKTGIVSYGKNNFGIKYFPNERQPERVTLITGEAKALQGIVGPISEVPMDIDPETRTAETTIGLHIFYADLNISSSEPVEQPRVLNEKPKTNTDLRRPKMGW